MGTVGGIANVARRIAKCFPTAAIRRTQQNPGWGYTTVKGAVDGFVWATPGPVPTGSASGVTTTTVSLFATATVLIAKRKRIPLP